MVQSHPDPNCVTCINFEIWALVNLPHFPRKLSLCHDEQIWEVIKGSGFGDHGFGVKILLVKSMALATVAFLFCFVSGTFG